MKSYIITAVIVLMGIAVAWVVIGMLISGGPVGRFEIPKGRYDYFLMTSGPILYSPKFPHTDPSSDRFDTALPQATYVGSRELMGATFSIGIYGGDETTDRLAAEEGFRRMEQIAKLVDLQNPDSELSIINRDAAEKPVKLSDELFFVIKRAQEISFHSEGAFDITSAPMLWLWQDYAARMQVPPGEKIRDTLKLVGWKQLEIDDKERTIKFAKKGVVIDLSNIIRGFAMDQAAWVMGTRGVDKGYIRMSTGQKQFDNYYFIGAPAGETFQAEIPNGMGKSIYTFTTDRPAKFCKGTFTRAQIIESRAITDIIDPRSGGCAAGVQSCTVIGQDAMTCDAMSAALCVLDKNRASRFIEKFNPPGSAEAD